MTDFESSSERPDTLLNSLHELGEATFESMFADNPPLNTCSNEMTASIHSDILNAFDYEEIDIDDETSSRLFLGVKKLIFLFTDPENYQDTIKDDTISPLLSVMLAKSGSLPGCVELINKYANSCMAVYKPRTEAQVGDAWARLSQTQKFWSVFGNFNATIESDGIM